MITVLLVLAAAALAYKVGVAVGVAQESLRWQQWLCADINPTLDSIEESLGRTEDGLARMAAKAEAKP